MSHWPLELTPEHANVATTSRLPPAKLDVGEGQGLCLRSGALRFKICWVPAPDLQERFFSTRAWSCPRSTDTDWGFPEEPVSSLCLDLLWFCRQQRGGLVPSAELPWHVGRGRPRKSGAEEGFAASRGLNLM